MARCADFGIAAGVQAGLGVAEHVGGAGVGDGIAGAVGRAHRDVVGGIVGLRLEELDRGIDDVLGLGEGGVGQARRCGRCAGPTSTSLAVAGAHHAAAGNADHAHVERTDIGLVAADAGIFDGRPAVADHADIGAGAADLEIDAVGHPQIHQRAGHARGRSRQHGHDRAAAHLRDIHHAAVAAHDHQRRLNAGLAHAGLGHGGGVDHLRQDAGVDDGGAGPRGQAVEFCDLVAAGRGEAGLDHQTAHGLLGLVVVDAEGRTGDDDLGAFGLEFVDRLADGLVGQRLLDQKAVDRRQVAAGRELDRLHGALAFGQQRFHAGRHADHADAGDVAFEQRVGGLRRRVGEEDDFLGIDAGLLQHVAEDVDHAFRDAARIGMGGQHGEPADHLVGRIVDQDGLGEGAADIDADAIGAGRRG